MMPMTITKDEFYILNNLYDAEKGRAASGTDVYLQQAVRNKEAQQALRKKGLIGEDGSLTAEGLAALEPYRVDSAVILAAGSATRFIPLSLEQPKGLYEVRGEKLIERQIQQLRQAGIEEITIILGYKREMFAYLEEKYGVRLLFNPEYNVKNNIASLLVGAPYTGNSYICVCDSYFTENPFHSFEYQTFYAGYSTEEQEDEMYADIDPSGRILSMEKGRKGGLMMLGHSFWQKAFTDAFFRLAEADRETGAYDRTFWEWLVNDHLGELPPMYYREFAPGCIREFDYFEQLRAFDVNYVSHARSDILRNIKLVFRCDEEDIADFRTVSEGLTNTSFIFRVDGTDYIYRHPGEGTERIINRRNEKRSLIEACRHGLDPTYVYMDVIEGWKISRFVHDFREPDYASFDDSLRVIDMMKKVHQATVQVDYGMRPWEDAEAMEALLKEKDPALFRPYEELKEKVGALYRKTLGDGVKPCFCHGDTYRPNWMLLPDGGVILIDWEYAGMSDPGIDIGYYIVDAMYGFDDALRFIRAYLGEAGTEQLEFHYLAYTAVIAYYWFVWALYRESCGADMGDVLENWRSMAERYVGYLTENEDRTE